MVTLGELSTELQKARDRVTELTGENEALARQVQGTAEIRIDEIKKDIGFAVRRVVRDIPDKSTKVSPESAQRMFIRLHEVLSELERRGIRVKGE